MKTISKFLLFALVLLLVGLGTVSASEIDSDSYENTDIVVEKEIIDNTIIEDTNMEADVNTSYNTKAIDKNNKIDNNKNVKGAVTTITVTNATFNQFFRQSDDFKTTELIQDNDIINLKGTFTNVNFTLDKPITLTSINNNAVLLNCSVRIFTEGSGSTVSNLIINNSKEYTSGMLIKDANNLLIENNYVEVCGLHSYGFQANINQSIIRSNYFETHKFDENTERTHTAMVFSDSYYNSIINNTVKSDGANCIYLSTYPGVEIRAGPSNYNNITGNIAYGANVGWCYTIQIMGSNNNITRNTVSGGYKGISALANNVIKNNEVDAWSVGIDAGQNNIVENNHVQVSNKSLGINMGGTGISVKNNTIITINGPAIQIEGNDASIIKNTINSQDYGIYAKGEYSNINVDNNKITSDKEGIIFKHQSVNKKINNVKVTRNNIESGAVYAIDFYEVGSRIASEVNVTVAESNVLKSSNGTGLDAAYRRPANQNQSSTADSNQVINITANNYTSWFENGISNSNVLQNATIYLKGTFNNLNFTFDKKVHVIGKTCVINNGTITFTGDAHSSDIKDVTIKNNKNDYNVHGIELIEVNNCKITNVKITNYGLYESFGIFLYGSNGNTITKNIINTSGDYLNDGIMVYASDSNKIDNNTININQSSVPRGYDTYVMFNERIGSIREVLHNHGIILIYSSGNTINKNIVKSTSMFTSYTAPSDDCQNSIVGIDIYFDSHNNNVTNNNLDINSFGPFTYGMGVLGAHWGADMTSSNATNNLFKNNQVSVKGGYYATGFIAGRNSVSTTVDSNTFNVQALKNSASHGDYGFGVILENSTKSTVSKNNMNVSAAAVYSIEIFDSGSNKIIQNNIYGIGTYPYAIAGYATSNNNILNNTMVLRKVNYGTVSPANHADIISVGDEGIMLMSVSSKNTISGNSIDTNATTTVKLTSDTRNNVVTNNALKSKKNISDSSVINQHTSNNVSNNFLYFVNVTVSPINAMLGDTVVINATVTSTASDLTNLTATFKLGTETIGTSQITNGKAKLRYKVSTLLNPTTYQLSVSVGGTNFQNTTAITNAVFEKSPDKIIVDVNKVTGIVGSNVTLTANITTFSGGKIGSGNVEFYVDDVLIETTTVRLGVSSVNYTLGSVPGVHEVKVKYLGTADYAPAEGTNDLGIQSKSTLSLSNYTASLGTKVTITATVKTGGKLVDTGDAIIKVNNTQVATVKVKNGTISYVYTIPTSMNKGMCNLQVSYLGNDTAAAVSKTSKITFTGYSPVFSYNTTSVKVNDTASLVLNVNNGLTGNKYLVANDGTVSIQIDGKVLKDSSGNTVQGNLINGTITFRFTVPNDLKGTHNITFVYSGNSKFDNGTQTFKNGLIVRKDTKLTITKINASKYNDVINITGKFTNEDGAALKNSNVKLNLNGVTYTVKTDDFGIYSYIYKATIVGKNNVTVSYPGNTKYNPTSTTTTFTVSKKDTKITMNSLSTVKYGDQVTVTGKFTNEDGNALINSNVKITINGIVYTAKTDSTGTYTYTFRASVVGKNNVTASYAGNAKYNGFSISKSFTVNKKDTQLTINTIPQTTKGKTATITGKFTNEDGSLLKNSNIKITINGQTFTVKTDTNAIYTYNYTTTTKGTNNVTVSYPGNAKYNSCEKSTTFKVV